jgi:hypothetical protein
LISRKLVSWANASPAPSERAATINERNMSKLRAATAHPIACGPVSSTEHLVSDRRDTLQVR